MNRYDTFKVQSADPLDTAYGKTNNALTEISTDIDNLEQTLGSPDWTAITNKPTVFPPEAHYHGWHDILDKPSSFPPSYHSHGWNEITNKPSTFTPSAHNHSISQVTDLSTTLTRLDNHRTTADIHRRITFGTADPSGGVDGDIYLKYQ